MAVRKMHTFTAVQALALDLQASSQEVSPCVFSLSCYSIECIQLQTEYGKSVQQLNFTNTLPAKVLR